MNILDIVSEGPNDPHIFKAIFLAGGPGSGKSFVSSKLLSGTGLRVVNSDDIYEYMMTKAGMKLDPETIFSPAGQTTREKAKAITKRKQSSHIDGRLGLIIDGTGKDVAKYAKTKKMLEDLGYDTMMLFVNTSLDVAQERNLQRARSLDPNEVAKMWNSVQQNIMAFQQLFGAARFYVVDNSGGLEDPSRKENFARVQKAIGRFINEPAKRREARAWLDAQKPSAVNEAEELGLTIFDIDETLFRTTAQIKVVKDGQVIRSLTNQEFNNYKLQPGEQFDFGEFVDAEKFNKESIPIKPMIAKLKAILNNAGNSKVIMLTARSDFDNKELFLDTFRNHGIDMNRVHVHRAGNLSGSPAQNKAVWIRKYLDTGKYSRIRLYDDSLSNIRMFNTLAKEYPDVKFFPYFVTHDGSIKTVRESIIEAETKPQGIINEALDNPYPYRWGVQSEDEWVARARTDSGAILDIRFEYGSWDAQWDIEFLVDGGYKATAAGDEFRIFATVVKVIKEWWKLTSAEGIPVNTIRFSADKLNKQTGKTGSREKLYSRFAQQFANSIGFTVQSRDKIDATDFELINPNYNEHKVTKANNNTQDISEAEAKPITDMDLKKLEFYADKIFRNLGIDVEFTRHFLDRANDQRNVRQITLPELAVLFRDEYSKWGKKIAQLGPDAEAVMKDMRSDINIPFALNWDSRNQELDLVAKTVMRKKNFRTPNPEFPVESRSFASQQTPMQDLISAYQFFTSFGQMGASSYAKSPDSEEKLKEVIRTLAQSNKNLQNLDKQVLEKNKNKILTHIHDMMNYAIAHFREHLKPERFDAKKKQINDLLTKYNNLASTNENIIHEQPDSNNYLLQLERDNRAGMLILHILNKRTGKRTEVRGKMGYETTGYDPQDKLHQLLDKVGKSASVSDLMNGDVVSINPRHPDGASAKVAADKAYNENVADGKVKYTKPQFDAEWEEAERYPEFVKIGKAAWIELASKGKAVTIKSARGINNTDAADPDSFRSLDKDKQARVLAQLSSGNIEMPIVAVYPDGWKELIGGNTRLTAMLAQDGRATVWAFKVPDEVAELAENFADVKKPNQLRGKDRAKTVKPSTTGSQPHPFKGKLVGNGG